MVQLIVGNKGKGKTKYLLDKVNDEIKAVQGNIVYIDKSVKHMFELNNKVRLINGSEYFINNSDAFIGFICGVISQDNDLQQMYFDSFLTVACIGENEFEKVFDKLVSVSEQFKVDFVLSISLNEDQLPESVKSNIIISL